MGGGTLMRQGQHLGRLLVAVLPLQKNRDLVNGGSGNHVMSEELGRQGLEQGLEEVGRRAS